MSWRDTNTEIVASYKHDDLLAGLGALQLVPENANHLLRLEAASALVSTRSGSEGEKTMTRAEWKAWLNGPVLAHLHIALHEDPQENVLVEEFNFYGGSYRVLPGIIEDATYILNHLCMAVFAPRDNPFAAEFRDGVAKLVLAALRVTDRVSKRAALQRGTRPVECDNVKVPVEEHFSRLKDAVVFSTEEFGEVDSGAASGGASALVTPVDEVIFNDERPWDSTLWQRPLVRLEDDRIVVALPGQLLASVRHAIIVAAQRRGCVSELRDRYRGAVAESVGEAVRLLGGEEKSEFMESAPDHISLQFGFDSDKEVRAYVVTDSLDYYDPEAVFGDLSSGVGGSFDDWVRGSEITTFARADPPNELFHLLVVQGIGRSFFAGIGDRVAPVHSLRQVFSGSDLEVISRIEVGDPLVLWKYARASEKVRDTVEIVASSPLDEFSVYRAHLYSYYFSDSGRPSMFIIPAGSSRELAFSAHDELDIHGAPHHRASGTIEVALVNGGSRDIPIYFPWRIYEDVPAHLVELEEAQIWVVGSRYDDRRFRDLSLQLVDMASYWTWQIGTQLRVSLPTGIAAVIRVDAEPSEEWFAESVELSDNAAVEVSHWTKNRAVLRLPAALSHLLHDELNHGERVVVAALTKLLSELPGPDDASRDTDGLVDVVAPVGLKKKMVMMDPSENLELEPAADLPKVRKLQEADVAVVLYEVGNRLQERQPVGPIAPGQRIDVLNGIVGELFSVLVRHIQTLKPEGLLEWLIRHNEALVRQEALQALLIPTRMACFPEHATVVDELIKSGPTMTTTAVSSRFLIEVVAATTPRGYRPISLDFYDRLIAVASEIFNKGWLSDSIHFGLSDYDLSLLPSGRLGVDRGGRFHVGRESFLPFYAQTEVDYATSTFSSHWRKTESTAAPPELDLLNEGAVAEFGFSLSDLVRVLYEVINVGRAQYGDVKSALADDLTVRIAASLEWDLAAVRSVLGLFMLKPRTEFLSPGPPFSRVDVYPWRFNRELSYVRKPLVVRVQDGVSTLLWGTRHVEVAARYLIVGLCYGGRLKARSSVMRSAMGKIREKEALAFERAVGEAYEACNGLVVQQRVKKIDGEPISRVNGEALGDIDVLVADPHRRIVLLNEAKDLALARTPAETRRELEDALGGGPGSSAARHLERTRWVRDRLDRLLRHLQINDEKLSRWSVQPVLVVDDVTMSPFVASCPVPILTLKQLRSLLARGGDTAEILHFVRSG